MAYYYRHLALEFASAAAEDFPEKISTSSNSEMDQELEQMCFCDADWGCLDSTPNISRLL
jgi:hypothetical protein